VKGVVGPAEECLGVSGEAEPGDTTGAACVQALRWFGSSAKWAEIPSTKVRSGWHAHLGRLLAPVPCATGASGHQLPEKPA